MYITVQYPSTCNLPVPCPYCYSRPSVIAEIGTPEQWAEWLLALPGTGHHFSFAFGEPTQERCVPLYRAVLDAGHAVTLTTNLYADPACLGNLRMSLCLSWHPHAIDLPTFAGRRLQCEAQGQHVGDTLAVAYPPYLQHIARWREEYRDFTGDPLKVLAYCGLHDGKRYPEAYTDAERAVVYGDSNPRYDEPVNWCVESPRGHRCRVGMEYMLIAQDGTARACPNDPQTVIGDVRTGITIPTEPVVCRNDRCGCVDLWRYIEP